MILLIDNYDSFTYNLKQELETLGARCRVERNDALTVARARALKPKAFVLSPGPGRPDSAGITLELIRKLAAAAGSTPLLGVCLGHQALGQAFGGNVVLAKRPRHGKVSVISHRGKGLFKGVEKRFEAARYHSLVVERRSLPACLAVEAESEDGEIMGVSHRELPFHGVQFHPESAATPSGRKLLANFLRMG